MKTYLKRLAFEVGGVFAGSLAASAAAAEVFNALTFDWGNALTVAGSLSTLALLKGVAARFVGDPESPSLTR
ncbi:hypothetical protein [Streptomyces sp. NPDC048338]|uniref:hypothetical protein n=1 Tax=Streptomyces sp. NPDC048338 TaxID=3365536 RepID=UPI003723DAD1